jgi:hypothetical protein
MGSCGTVRLLSVVFLAGILSFLGCAALEAESAGVDKTPERILFIGNSLSNDLNKHLKGLAASAIPPLDITADASISMGTVLEGLWSFPDKHERILKGNYDRVILQATLSETGKVAEGRVTADTEEKFHRYARSFDREIRESGARTVLFMHWQFDEPGAMRIERIAALYRDVAEELGVEVAPVGLAWQRARRERPDLQLLSDSVHASFRGEYLAACVFYATLFERSPVGLPYLGTIAMDPELAAFLQRIAWETVQDYEQPSFPHYGKDGQRSRSSS